MANKVRFFYYLNDDVNRYSIRQTLIDGGLDVELAERLAEVKPFNEVTLECEVDEETLEVAVLAALF